MAKVIVSIKIFPSDITVDLVSLKQKIRESLPKYVSVYRFDDEPIAFGLIALIAHVIVPEEKPGSLDEVEKHLRKIDEISEIETLMARKV